MNFLAKIIRYFYLHFRVFFYKCISTIKVNKNFVSFSPVLCEGKGKIVLKNNVSFGFVSDTDFWTSYCFLNPRNVESKIEIGENCKICNHFTAISEGEGIIIGNSVLIGTGVSIYDSDFHEITPEKRLNGIPKKEKVIIGNNVWIGDKVTILKGSTIGNNCVIGACSLVTGKFPDNVIIGGIPAKIIREI